MQSRKMSLLETFIGTAIGYGVAVAANAIVLPMFGLTPSIGDSYAIAGVFTAISIIRSYIVRRMFNFIQINSPSYKNRYKPR